MVYTKKRKAESLEEFQTFKQTVETLFKKAKALKSDNGLEYAVFVDSLKQHGIENRRSVTYTAEQNDRAERLNQTSKTVVRCLLVPSGVAESFWAEALQFANYVRNRCVGKANHEIPCEVWFKRQLKKKDFLHLMTSSCEAWAAIINPNRLKKLGPRVKKYIILGYEDGVKGYRIWSLTERKIILARDGRFGGDSFPCNQRRNKTLM